MFGHTRIVVCLIASACAAQGTVETTVHIEPLPASPVASAAPSSSASSAPTRDVVLPDGLEIHDLRIGTGDELTRGATAVVHYVGTLRDGTEFDSSRKHGQPFTTPIPGRLIPGWNEGLLGMRVGGLRRLIIPPSLAYGERAFPGIPAGSTLTYEIELLEVR